MIVKNDTNLSTWNIVQSIYETKYFLPGIKRNTVFLKKLVCAESVRYTLMKGVATINTLVLFYVFSPARTEQGSELFILRFFMEFQIRRELKRKFKKTGIPTPENKNKLH